MDLHSQPVLSFNRTIQLREHSLLFALKKFSSSSSDRLNPLVFRNVTKWLAILEDVSSLTNLYRSTLLVTLNEGKREVRWNEKRELCILQDAVFDAPPLFELNFTSSISTWMIQSFDRLQFHLPFFAF